MAKEVHNRRHLVGNTYGYLTVIAELDTVKYSSGPSSRYLCLCKCGKKTEVLGGSLTTGNTKSCGCLKLQMTIERSTTHGLTGVRAYRIWQAMVSRCRYVEKEAYKQWGGRGITVCDRWKNFEPFLEDMGHPPAGASIDRIDNDGNYEPGNCRWSTRLEQSRNRSDNRMITFMDETLCLKDWVLRLNMDQSSMRERLEKWPLDVALTRPKMARVKYVAPQL